MRMGLAALTALLVVSGPVLAQVAPAKPAGRPAQMDPAAMQRNISMISLKAAVGIMKIADTNKDGKISKAEMDAYARKSGVPTGIDPRAWARTDTNHDGYATLPELMGAIRFSLEPAAAAHPASVPAHR